MTEKEVGQAIETARSIMERRLAEARADRDRTIAEATSAGDADAHEYALARYENEVKAAKETFAQARVAIRIEVAHEEKHIRLQRANTALRIAQTVATTQEERDKAKTTFDVETAAANVEFINAKQTIRERELAEVG